MNASKTQNSRTKCEKTTADFKQIMKSHTTYITHTLELNFKGYNKIKTIFFSTYSKQDNFLYKDINNFFYIKKSSKKKHVKDVKIFLKKKQTKSEKKPKKDIKTSLKKEMEKSIGIIVNVIKVFQNNKCRS